MKFIFVAHDSALTGASKSMLTLISCLSNANHLILVFIPEKGELEKELLRKNIEVAITRHRVNVSQIVKRKLFCQTRNFRFRFIRLFQNIILSFKWKNLAKEFAPDYVISNTSTSLFGFLISKQVKCKHVWHLREFGELDHGFKPDFPILFAQSLMASHKIICISNAIKDFYKVKYKLINCELLYNAIYSYEEFKSNFKTDKNIDKNFIFVGQLTKNKGIWITILAFEKYLTHNNNTKLRIFGDGPEFKQIQEYLWNNNLTDTIELHGFKQDLALYFSEADCMVMASENEAFGRTTIEAVSFGCLIIANESGGATKEFLKNYESALFYDGSIVGLVNALSAYEKLDFGSKQHLKLNAYSYCRTHFQTDNYAEKFISLL